MRVRQNSINPLSLLGQTLSNTVMGTTMRQWAKKSQLTLLWQTHQISNFEYLMQLNTLAGTCSRRDRVTAESRLPGRGSLIWMSRAELQRPVAVARLPVDSEQLQERDAGPVGPGQLPRPVQGAAAQYIGVDRTRYTDPSARRAGMAGACSRSAH